MNEYLKILWEQLSQSGKFGNLGTLDEFSTRMADPAKRKSFYDQVSPYVKNLGTFDEFESRIAPEKKNQIGSTPSEESSSIPPGVPIADGKFEPVGNQGVQSNNALKVKMDWSTGDVTSVVPPVKGVDVPTAEALSTFDWIMGLMGAFDKGVTEDAIAKPLKGFGEFETWLLRHVDDDFKAEDSWLYWAGQAIEDASEWAFIAYPEVDQSFAGQTARGLGQATGMIATAPEATATMATRAPSLVNGSKALLLEGSKQLFSRPAVIGAFQMIGHGANDVRAEVKYAKGVSRDKYIKAKGDKGAGKTYDRLTTEDPEDIIADLIPGYLLAGSTEAIPLVQMFGRIDKLSGGTFKRQLAQRLMNIGAGTAEGAIQEAVQQWITNLTDRDVYDYTKDLTEGLEENAKVGGAVQFVLEALMNGLGAGRITSNRKKAMDLVAQKQEKLAEGLTLERVKNAEPEELAQMGEEGQAVKEIVDKIPEENLTPEIAEIVQEKTDIENEIKKLNEEKDKVDETFHPSIDEKIASLEEQKGEVTKKLQDATEKRKIKEGDKPEHIGTGEEGLPKETGRSDSAVKGGETFISGQWEVTDGKVHKKGKPDEIASPTTSRKILKEFADAKIDEFAMQGERVEDVPETEMSDTVLSESTNPAQIAEAWRAEPDKTKPEDRKTAIQSFLSKISLGGDLIGQFIGGRTKSEKAMAKAYSKKGKPVIDDLSILKEELDDFLMSEGLDPADESEIKAAIEDNPRAKKVEFKVTTNKTKKALGGKFRELTGVPLTPEYADRIIERHGVRSEEAGIPPLEPVEAIEPGGGKKRSGFEQRSLPKAEKQSKAKGIVKKVADANPSLYNSLNLKQYESQVEKAIEEDGMDAVIDELMSTDPGAVPSDKILETQAKRIFAAVHLGEQLVKANDAGDMKKVDSIRRKLDKIEGDLAQQGTRGGQESAYLAVWSATPEGMVVNTIRRLAEKRNQGRSQGTKSGKTVGEVADAITEEIAKEIGISADDVKKILAKAYGRKAAVKKAKIRISAAQKKIEEARSDLKKALLGRTQATLIPVPTDPKIISALAKLFTGYAEKFAGNIQKIRANFSKDVKGMGIDPNSVWEHIKDVVGPVEEFAGKVEQAILGFYSADSLGGDLESALKKIGVDDDVASDIANEFHKGVKDFLKKSRMNKLNKIVRGHETDTKKAKAIQDGLIEAIAMGGLNDDNIRAAIESKYGLSQLSTQNIAEIHGMIGELKTLPSDEKKAKKVTEILDYIKLHGGRESLSEFAKSIWYASVLSDIRTHISILIGNTLQSVNQFAFHGIFTEGGRYALSNVGSDLMNAITGKTNLLDSFRGIAFGFKEFGAILSTGKGFKTMDKFSISPTLERLSKRPWGRSKKSDAAKFVALGLRYVARAMGGLDAIHFYASYDFTMDRMAYKSALAEGLTGRAARKRADEILNTQKDGRKKWMDQAKVELSEYAKTQGKAFDDLFTKRDILYRARELSLQKVNELTPNASSKALRFAQDVSLQGPARGVWGRMVQFITGSTSQFVRTPDQVDNKYLKPVAKALHAYGDVFYPFFNVMARMIDINADFVPIVGAAQKVVVDRIIRGEPSIDFSNVDEKTVFWARQAFGTFLLGYLLAASLDDDDNEDIEITANGPKNREKRAQWFSQGNKPYSIRIGGHNAYYRDSPLGGLFSVIGGVQDNLKYGKQEEDPISMSHDIAAAMLGYMTNASMLQQVGTISDGISSGNFSKVLSGLASPIKGVTNPGAARWADRVLSPELRDRRQFDDVPVAGRFLGEIIANTVIVSNYTLDLKFNALGDDINPQKYQSKIEQFLGTDKYWKSAKSDNPIFDVMAEKNLFFPRIGENNTIYGTPMTYAEFAKYARIVTRFRKKILEPQLDIMRTMSSDELIKALRAIDRNGRQLAEYIVHENDVKTLTTKKIDSLLMGYDRILNDTEDLKYRLNDGVDEEDIEIPDNFNVGYY